MFETVEVELMVRLGHHLPNADSSDPRAILLAGADAWLDASTEPEVQRIVLLDGPAVLGWERWRDIGLRYGLGLVSTVLADAMAAGSIAQQPVDPLAHALVGSLDEAALYVARAPDPVTAAGRWGRWSINSSPRSVRKNR